MTQPSPPPVLCRAPLPLRALVLLIASLGSLAPAGAQEILPFSEVKPGMKGTGRTVFSGTRVEEFQVEVIGTLQNVAPKRNLILVRLSGGPLASTGVLDGMSGSPVYFGDRLAGAVLPAHFASYFDALPRAAGISASLVPMRTPLLFGGLPASVIDSLAPGLARAGLLAVQGGSASHAPPGTDAGLAPGAGVGIKLVRGDVEIAAICTVTYRDRDRVLACGHPLLNLGPTDLLMTTASVNGLFPSLQESFKFASSGEEIGAFRQDRATGVFGYLGKKPRLFPVRVELQPEKGVPRRYAFDVVEDPFLAPYLVYAALNGILSNAEKDYGAVALAYKEGTTIRVSGEDAIELHNLFSGDQAALYTSGTVAFLTQILLNNEYRPAHLEGINLIIGYSDEERTARLERAWLSRDRARPGETVQVSISLKPFRGPAVTRQVDIKIPEEAQPGRLLLQVGDGIALARAEGDDEDFSPRDLKQLIWLINHLRSNNTVYALLIRTDNGIVYQGQRLPNLPPSVAQVMVRPQTHGNYLRLWYRGVAEESIETNYMLSGYKLLSIDVEE